MSSQYYEYWFPECVRCGCGNVGKVVCLDEACHARNKGKIIDNEMGDGELIESNGHYYKCCVWCRSQMNADPCAWESKAICSTCWNKQEGIGA